MQNYVSYAVGKINSNIIVRISNCAFNSKKSLGNTIFFFLKWEDHLRILSNIAEHLLLQSHLSFTNLIVDVPPDLHLPLLMQNTLHW